MADVKDILGLPKGGAEGAGAGAGAAAKPKAKIQKPAGMSREAFALLDQSHPIMPSVLGQLTKKAKAEKTKIRSQWRWKLFKNAARSDGLELYHWERIHGAPGSKMGTMGADGEYVFSKYNKKIKTYRYDDEEYRTLLSGDPSWSREESDYLMDMCERFDLRFVVIADRYDFNGATRKVEDLKQRYYDVARKLVIAREGSEKAAAHNPVVKRPFNADHERERKRALEIVLARSAAQEREERAILQQAAEIEANRRLESIAAQKSGVVKTDALDEGVHECNYGLFEKRNNPSLCSSTGILQKPAFPGVFARRRFTQKTAQEVMSGLAGGQRTQKVFEAILHEMGLPHLTAATQASCSAWVQLHVEIAELLELKKGELAKGVGASGLPAFLEAADLKPPKAAVEGAGAGAEGDKSQGLDGGAGGAGGSGATGGTPKQEPATVDLTTTPSLTGRRSRDANKRKTPARFDDMAMSTPRSESKRSRTR
uniref:Myb-like domain-containing protein n=1 Tax=Chloropicon laureae TaxID=464258 RepID=A0A7S2Z5F0_9CHLO